MTARRVDAPTPRELSWEMASLTIRSASAEDAAIIAHHRVSMFREMGNIPSETIADALFAASATALAEALRDRSYIGWVAVDPDGQVIAGAGVHIKPQLPRVTPDRQHVVSTPVPLVVNVYTEPAWRRQGVARALMRDLMRWATEHEYDRVLLHASHDGRPLYASLGFVPTNEMRWDPNSIASTE